jgi:hypothetical protein
MPAAVAADDDDVLLEAEEDVRNELKIIQTWNRYC